MKHLLILSVCLLFMSAVHAITDPGNTSCASAVAVCGNTTNTRSFDLAGTSFCQSSKVKLYYSLQYGATGASSTILGVNTGSTTNSVKVFGPFASVQSGCEAFNTLAAPIGTFSGTSYNIAVATVKDMYYLVEVTVNSCSGSITVTGNKTLLTCTEPLPCTDCIGTFQPPAGNYVFSAWAREAGAALTKTSYTFPKVTVSSGGTIVGTFFTSGPIIDGWQKIEGAFTIASTGSSFDLSLISLTGDVYYDDIRIFPFDGSMMSYAYDPVTLRLVAELDERNYAKFYEYDEEGKLIRVKKETEAGISTIQENRENSSRP